MGKKQKHEIRLTQEERTFLIDKTSSGDWSARKIKRAQVLLKTDKNQKKPLEDSEVAEELHCSRSIVPIIRARFAKQRLKSLEDKPRAGRPKKFDGESEAHIIATACSNPPEGRERWTLRLIADRVVRLTEVETCSHSTVGNILKKANLSLG